MIGNIYQAQAAEPGRQEAILELARRVIIRWADQADLVVVGGDWNASTRPRVGYVGSQVTRGADARLQEWYLREDLTCAAPEHATWQSVNESRHAVLDCFFWRSKSDGPSIRGAEAFLSTDPRLDHDIVRVTVDGGNIGPMPSLETLCTPVRLKMQKFSGKVLEYQTAVTRRLSQPDSASESDSFREWERVKRIALDCAKAVFGTTGGRLPRIIPHRSQEERRLKARLTLLRVVRRELYALKNSLVATTTRAIRRVWDMGLYPQPANVGVLKGLWLPEHQVWTESWLRMLRRQSAETVEAWHCFAGRNLLRRWKERG